VAVRAVVVFVAISVGPVGVAKVIAPLVMLVRSIPSSVEHLEYYLDEFTFRFDRRTSRSRGLLFYSLRRQALDTDRHRYNVTSSHILPAAIQRVAGVGTPSSDSITSGGIGGSGSTDESMSRLTKRSTRTRRSAAVFPASTRSRRRQLSPLVRPVSIMWAREDNATPARRSGGTSSPAWR
jgi:hypothetical protein